MYMMSVPTRSIVRIVHDAPVVDTAIIAAVHRHGSLRVGLHTDSDVAQSPSMHFRPPHRVLQSSRCAANRRECLYQFVQPAPIVPTHIRPEVFLGNTSSSTPVFAEGKQIEYQGMRPGMSQTAKPCAGANLVGARDGIVDERVDSGSLKGD